MSIFTTRGGGDHKVMGTIGLGSLRHFFAALESLIRHAVIELLTVEQNSAEQMNRWTQAPLNIGYLKEGLKNSKVWSFAKGGVW